MDAISFVGWDIVASEDVEWMPWGGGNARAKVLGSADRYSVVLVEAEPGYEGTADEHEHAEFGFLVAGTVRNQGRIMVAGDAWAAAAGSTHTDFATETGATYVVIFKI